MGRGESILEYGRIISFRESQVPSLLAGLRNRHFFLIDTLILLISPTMALAIRLDTLHIPERIQAGLVVYTLAGLFIYLSLFYSFGIYRRYWQYASSHDLAQIVFAATAATFILTFILYLILYNGLSLPRSILIINAMLVGTVSSGTRFLVRYAYLSRHVAAGGRQRSIIFGAGDAGAMIVGEMLSKPQLGYQPIAFLDDDPKKHRMRIHGLPVLGGRQSINEVIRTYRPKFVIIAMPTAPGQVIQEISTACDLLQVEKKIVPDLSEIIDGRIRVGQLRDVDIQDLLRRDPVRTDIELVRQELSGKRILITGGGGSIGSELCRQILFCRPSQLFVLGHGENSVFEIIAELRRFGLDGVALTPIIADVRFADRIDTIFGRFKPEIVFHAAAHKHVPLMEANPSEAITNNVLGTRNVLEACVAHDVGRFVLISTDKAVNPTSVMGASKRVAELLVCDTAQRYNKPYVSVRFGNVLGSRGSVVLTFKKQIIAGGPVTVTDPQVDRYFMTIPEAVQLVLQAAVIGRRGEVLVLDMGEPVTIDALARRMIELYGLEVGQDIDIVYTGLRPGEKLHEELFSPGEQPSPTRHRAILRAKNGFGQEAVLLNDTVDDLITAAIAGDQQGARVYLHTLVPDFSRF